MSEYNAISKRDQLVILRKDYDEAKAEFDALAMLNTSTMTDWERARHAVHYDLANIKQRVTYSAYKKALDEYC